MKVKVIKRFVDAGSRKVMEVGSVAEYAAERARSLIERGYVEEVKEKEEKKAEPKAEKKAEPKKTAKKAPAKKKK